MLEVLRKADILRKSNMHMREAREPVAKAALPKSFCQGLCATCENGSPFHCKLVGNGVTGPGILGEVRNP